MVTLPEELTSDKEVSIQSKDNIVSFQLLNQSDQPKIARTLNGQPTMKSVKAEKSIEKEARRLAKLEEKSSTITYKNALVDTDIKYDVTPNSLKESVVIRFRPKNTFTLSYELSVGSLQPTLLDDGSIIFYSEDNEEIFTMPSPYMFDSATDPSFSSAIEVSLDSQGHGRYLLKYKPDMDWILNNDREYPITIDPSIETSRTAVNDCYVQRNSMTNYGNSPYILIGSNNLGLVKFNTLPKLAANSMVVDATLHMFNLSGTAYVGAAPVKTLWNESNMNGTMISSVIDESYYYDLQYANGFKWVTFDITQPATRWYAGEGNNGIALLSQTGSVTMASREYGENNQYAPYMTIEYAYLNGINNEMEGYVQDIGRAGTAVVNAMTGQLSIKNTLMNFEGSSLPVELNLQYGGYYNGLPSNWMFNYNQYIYGGNGSYTYRDADGAIHQIKYNAATDEWTDELGMIYENINETGERILETVDGYQYYFESSGGGFLKKIVDTNKPNNPTLTIDVEGSGRINYIYDGNGRRYTFTYNTDGDCSGITYWGKGSTSLYHLDIQYYPYSGGLIGLRILYPDNNLVEYRIDTLNRVTRIEISAGSYYTYTYLGSSANETEVTEFGTDGTRGKKFIMNYDKHSTTYKELDSKNSVIQDSIITQHFSDFGQLTSITDGNNNLIRFGYSEEKAITDIASSSPSISNPFPNASFEEPGVLQGFSITASNQNYNYNTHYAEGHTGGYSMALSSPVENTIYLYSGLDLPEYPNKKVTFSIWARTELDAKVSLMIFDGSNWLSSEPVTTGGEWQRVSITTTMVNNILDTGVQVKYEGTGILFIDDFQYYQGESNDYPLNLLYDTDTFSDGWSNRKNVLSTSQLIEFNGRSIHTLSMDNSYHSNAYVTKQVYVNAPAGQKFTLSISGKIPAIISNKNKDEDTMVGIKVSSPDLEVIAVLDLADFFTSDCQYISGTAEFTLPFSCTYLNLSIISKGQNRLELFAPSLVAGNSAYDYSYVFNDANEIVSRRFEADTSVQSPEISDPEEPLKTTFADGAYWITFNEENGKAVIKYDKHGNMTESLQTTNNKTRTTSQTYTDDGSFLKSSTDASGIETNWNYDTDLGYLLSYEKEDGSGINYTYDEMGRLIASEHINGEEATYTYNDNDQMESIITDGETYTFTYTPFGEIETVSEGDETLTEVLVTYAYSDLERNLTSISYANGQTITYIYNDMGYLESAKQGNTIIYNYLYDDYGEKIGVEDPINHIKTITQNNHTRVWDTQSNTLLYEYATSSTDTGSNFLYKIDGKAYQVNYFTDDSGIGNTVFKSDSLYTYQAVNTTDSFGRIQSKSISHQNNNILTSTYTYQDTSTIALDLIQSVAYKTNVSNSLLATYSYTYDQNGRIKTIRKNNVLQYTYTYDNMGQLTRVDDAVQNKSFRYYYNLNGSFYKISASPYTTGQLGTPTETHNFSHGERKWKNLYTAIDGKSITYDDMYNPVTYDGYTFGWTQGRKLESITGNGSVISYSYDPEGNRISKTVNGDTTKYTWMNGKLIKLVGKISGQISSDSLLFTYGADDRPLSVRFRNADYFYLWNMQGDVIGLVNNSGNLVVEYTYDAWGNLIDITGTQASMLGELNPFRYRGYIYDTETGYYYLNTRYYVPEWGSFLNPDDTNMISISMDSVLNYNIFSYCKNDPINYSDPSGMFLIYSVDTYYYPYDFPGHNPAYLINTEIRVFNCLWVNTFTYTLVDDGVLKFRNYVYAKAFWEILGFGLSRILSDTMYNTAKSINPSYLSFRTKEGIHTELVLHWFVYYALGIESHVNVADMGGIFNPGYDDNAWIFELSFVQDETLKITRACGDLSAAYMLGSTLSNIVRWIKNA